MTETCGAEHARWLERALAEGPEALDASARHALEACPRCSGELGELAALEGLLGRTAEDEREVLAEVTDEARERELEFVTEVHRTRLASGAAPEHPRRRARFTWWLAAAGLLVALYLSTRDRAPQSQPGPPSDPDVYLSGPHALVARDLEPNGTVAAFDALRWQPGEELVSSWQVVVEDAEGAELWRSDRVHGTSVELDPEKTATWPDRIRWTVTPLDIGGRLRPEAAAHADALRSR